MSETVYQQLRDRLFPPDGRTDCIVDEEILASAHEIRLSAGATAFHQGDGCTSFLLVLEGTIKVLARSPAGREIVLYRVRPGETCVLTTSCLLAQGHYPAEGIAESPVHALAIPVAAFQRGLDRSAPFRQFVFRTYGERLANIIALVEDLNFGPLKSRLARLLLQQAVDGELKATHQQLAAELGTAREVVSRQLKEFEQQGWISAGRGHIQLRDRAALQALLDSPV
jgi:CRP/FNR family transcriptional regulator